MISHNGGAKDTPAAKRISRALNEYKRLKGLFGERAPVPRSAISRAAVEALYGVARTTVEKQVLWNLLVRAGITEISLVKWLGGKPTGVVPRFQALEGSRTRARRPATPNVGGGR